MGPSLHLYTVFFSSALDELRWSCKCNNSSHCVRQAGAGGWSWNGLREKYCWSGWSWSWWLKWCERKILLGWSWSVSFPAASASTTWCPSYGATQASASMAIHGNVQQQQGWSPQSGLVAG